MQSGFPVSRLKAQGLVTKWGKFQWDSNILEGSGIPQASSGIFKSYLIIRFVCLSLMINQPPTNRTRNSCRTLTNSEINAGTRSASACLEDPKSNALIAGSSSKMIPLCLKDPGPRRKMIFSGKWSTIVEPRIGALSQLLFLVALESSAERDGTIT